MVVGIVRIVTGGVELDAADAVVEIDRFRVTSGILFLSASVTLLMALPSMVVLHLRNSLWALRTLRVAALVFTTLNAFSDFAASGFGALPHLAIGLFTMAVLSHHITVRTETAGATAPSPVGDNLPKTQGAVVEPQ
ncbi:hypothetical protein [Rhodococcus zopfii]|uniref:hypothetical protein n=1 Tax=Rhodococcus zopfii TaxID=43772 RepID=UPI001EDF279D|nr:hypothetical protein [Rhodococcus zopfii]